MGKLIPSAKPGMMSASKDAGLRNLGRPQNMQASMLAKKLAMGGMAPPMAPPGMPPAPVRRFGMKKMSLGGDPTYLTDSNGKTTVDPSDPSLKYVTDANGRMPNLAPITARANPRVAPAADTLLDSDIQTTSGTPPEAGGISNAQLGSLGAIGSIAGGAINSFDPKNGYGVQSQTGATASGALSGAGAGMKMGAQFGPAGAAIGAGLGAITGGILSARANAKAMGAQTAAIHGQEVGLEKGMTDQSNARLSGNLNKITGTNQQSFYRKGGMLQHKGPSPAMMQQMMAAQQQAPQGMPPPGQMPPGAMPPQRMGGMLKKYANGGTAADQNYLQENNYNRQDILDNNGMLGQVVAPGTGFDMRVAAHANIDRNVEDVEDRNPSFKDSKSAIKEYGSHNYMHKQVAAAGGLLKRYADGGEIPSDGLDEAGPGDKYRTKLAPKEQAGYDSWRSKLPKALQWDGDYDLKGLYHSNPNQSPSANLHFPDTYKLPNHPTFSDESNYYNPTTKSQAGHWSYTDSSSIYTPYDPKVKHRVEEMNEKRMGGLLKKYADGGATTAPGNMANQPAQGGNLTPMSKNTAMVQGPSHEGGGVAVPGMNAEVEGGETTSGNFVFSKDLGFADKHTPIAKALGAAEKKPSSLTNDNTIRLLKAKEDALKQQQEQTKAQMNIPNDSQAVGAPQQAPPDPSQAPPDPSQPQDPSQVQQAKKGGLLHHHGKPKGPSSSQMQQIMQSMAQQGPAGPPQGGPPQGMPPGPPQGMPQGMPQGGPPMPQQKMGGMLKKYAQGGEAGDGKRPIPMPQGSPSNVINSVANNLSNTERDFKSYKANYDFSNFARLDWARAHKQTIDNNTTDNDFLLPDAEQRSKYQNSKDLMSGLEPIAKGNHNFYDTIAPYKGLPATSSDQPVFQMKGNPTPQKAMGGMLKKYAAGGTTDDFPVPAPNSGYTQGFDSLAGIKGIPGQGSLLAPQTPAATFGQAPQSTGSLSPTAATPTVPNLSTGQKVAAAGVTGFLKAGKLATGASPFMADIYNMNRQLPNAPTYQEQSLVQPSLVDFSSSRQAAQSQGRASSVGANRVLGSGAEIAAVTAANGAATTEKINQANEAEGNANAQIKNQANTTNSYINARNVAGRNEQMKEQVSRINAQQGLMSSSLAKLGDKAQEIQKIGNERNSENNRLLMQAATSEHGGSERLFGTMMDNLVAQGQMTKEDREKYRKSGKAKDAFDDEQNRTNRLNPNANTVLSQRGNGAGGGASWNQRGGAKDRETSDGKETLTY